MKSNIVVYLMNNPDGRAAALSQWDIHIVTQSLSMSPQPAASIICRLYHLCSNPCELPVGHLYVSLEVLL